MARPAISKQKQKEIAKSRIENLFEQADLRFNDNKGLANRYVTLARKLAMKVRLRMPTSLKRKYCKHCYKYLRAGVNSKVRTREGKIVISCFECKKFTRILIKRIRKK